MAWDMLKKTSVVYFFQCLGCLTTEMKEAQAIRYLEIFKQMGLQRALKRRTNNLARDILTNIHNWTQRQSLPPKTTSQLLLKLGLIKHSLKSDVENSE